MLVRLVDFVAELPEEELADVTLQDVAICDAWFRSLDDSDEQRKTYTKVPEVVDRWTALVKRPERPTEGRRHQWILRELINTLQGGQLAGLSRDELELVISVCDLAERAADRSLFERVRDLLEPFAKSIKQRAEGLPPAPSLPRIDQRLLIISEEDLLNARPREVKVFAGINLPFIGPVYAHKGHVRVLDNVPDGCALVVENGSCSVEGYVMGRIAASESCEVRENISGVVVVREGDIRTRNVIDNALIVSKKGNVYCRDAQAPNLVFACGDIHIETNAIMGRYLANRVICHGHVTGGEYHISNRLTAERFRCSRERPLNIVFREEVSCRDYGEAPDKEMSQMLASAARLRRRIEELNALVKIANREAEHSAGVAILYVSTGDSKRPSMERIDTGERRLAMLDRLTSSLDYFIHTAAEHMTAKMAGANMGVGAGQAELEALVSPAELEQILSDVEFDGQMRHFYEEDLVLMTRLRDGLFQDKFDKAGMLALLASLRILRSKRVKERAELASAIENRRSEIELTEATPNGSGSHAKRSNVARLKRLLASVQETDADSVLVERMKSTFVRSTLRSLQNSLAKSKQWREQLEKVREEFAKIREILAKEYRVAITEQGRAKGVPPRAEGHFEEGVRIVADPFLLDEPEPLDQVVLVTGRAGLGAYMRSEEGLVVPLHTGAGS